MRANGAGWAIAFLLVGAALAVAAREFLRGTDTVTATVDRAQLDLILGRLAQIEEALGALRQPSEPAETTSSVQPVRTNDVDVQVLRALQDIRNSLLSLARAQAPMAAAEPGGIDKDAATLAKTIEADGYRSVDLTRRHFCWTPAQVYAAYGMPDSRGGGVGASTWSYRIDGTDKWMLIQFIDGIVTDVRVPASGN